MRVLLREALDDGQQPRGRVVCLGDAVLERRRRGGGLVLAARGGDEALGEGGLRLQLDVAHVLELLLREQRLLGRAHVALHLAHRVGLRLELAALGRLRLAQLEHVELREVGVVRRELRWTWRRARRVFAASRHFLR